MRRFTRRGLLAATAAAFALPARRTTSPGPDLPPLPEPLPRATFLERQRALRESARAAGFDALFVTPSTNLRYTANIEISASERLIKTSAGPGLAGQLPGTIT